MRNLELPEGFSLFEEGGVTEFPLYADMGHPTYPVSYLVHGRYFHCFRVNEPIKSALAEFQQYLSKCPA